MKAPHIELGLSNDPPQPLGGIAAGVFLVQYTLYYKKRQELQLAQAAFPQGGPENNYIAIVATEIFSVNKWVQNKCRHEWCFIHVTYNTEQ